MVKLATSVLAVSLLALPALAAPAERYERSVAESDLYDRDLANVGNIIVTREDLYEIFGREFVDDIEERSPFGLGAIFHVAKAIAGKVGHHSHHIPSMGSNNNNNNNNRREFDEEELEAREPFGFGAIFHIAKGIAGKVGHHSHHIPSMGSNNNNNNNNRREFDEEELEAREPFGFGSVFHIAKGIAGKVGHHSHHHIPSVDLNSNNNNNNNNNNRREFDEEEFDLRDFDEDLEAREPIDVEKVLHRAHRVYRAAQYIPTGNYNDRRDLVEEVFEREFDDEELLEREYYDDLD